MQLQDSTIIGHSGGVVGNPGPTLHIEEQTLFKTTKHMNGTEGNLEKRIMLCLCFYLCMTWLPCVFLEKFTGVLKDGPTFLPSEISRFLASPTRRSLALRLFTNGRRVVKVMQLRGEIHVMCSGE